MTRVSMSALLVKMYLAVDSLRILWKCLLFFKFVEWRVSLSSLLADFYLAVASLRILWNCLVFFTFERRASLSSLHVKMYLAVDSPHILICNCFIILERRVSMSSFLVNMYLAVALLLFLRTDLELFREKSLNVVFACKIYLAVGTPHIPRNWFRIPHVCWGSLRTELPTGFPQNCHSTKLFIQNVSKGKKC